MGFVRRMCAWVYARAQKTKQLLCSSTMILLQKRRIALLILVIFVVALLVSLLIAIWIEGVFYLHLPSMGTIRIFGLKAYRDIALTNEAANITWGTLSPGSALNVTVYLRSISNAPIKLNSTTANWVLRNSHDEIRYGPVNDTDHLKLDWDYNGSTIGPGQVVPLVFTLRADYTSDFIEYVIQNDVQQFSFDISVHAVEVYER